MRRSIRPTDYVCVSCLLREGGKRLFSSSRLGNEPAKTPDVRLQFEPPESLENSTATGFIRRSENLDAGIIRKVATKQSDISELPTAPNCPQVRIKSRRQLALARHREAKPFQVNDGVSKRAYSSVNAEGIELSAAQLNELQAVNRLRARLQSGLSTRAKSNEQSPSGLPLQDALKLLQNDKKAPKEEELIRKLEGIYNGRELSEVLGDLAKLSEHRRPRNRVVKDEHTKKLLGEFGLLDAAKRERTADVADRGSPTVESTHQGLKDEAGPASANPVRDKTVEHNPTQEESKGPVIKLDESRLQVLEARNLAVRPLPVETLPVPTLSYGLRRVLFNQGIHQLQDSRSGVFNFDPYLQRIMPVSEFNYDALGEYITSSEDNYLRRLAHEHGKKYIGSSSSMSGILSHFHHLLSKFRDINTGTLSQSFSETSKTLTLIQKAPSSVFLRYRDGVYGVDADKEYDSANVLMSLGRSMEKLLTVPKEEFEKYRKGALPDTELGKLSEAKPESYHYCEQGDFLLRSQLDAYDSNLPGSGMFDLKTRAVVSIRMNVSKHEEGVGYQIKSRFGNYESYEREYYDMIRSAFLKYSLQVRMGRMDGIFVAYHNVERIFGFQYMPLSEMDLALHGQTDRTLGDTEFKLSIGFINKVFDRATKKFPGRSLRFHFEARPGTSTNPTQYMYIFAEPLEEDHIQRIQDSRKAKIAEFERRIFNATPESTAAESASELSSSPSSPDIDTADIAADLEFLDELTRQQATSQQTAPTTTPPTKATEGPIMGLKLTIRNKQNGNEVPRPADLKRDDVWTVEYNMEEMSVDAARRLYSACQARRKTALSFDESDNGSVNYYLKRLKDLSRSGAAWRKKQDEIDAQRGVIVV